MRLVIVESTPGELEDLPESEVHARLEKAFDGARATLVQAAGRDTGDIAALGELSDLLVKSYQRRIDAIRELLEEV